MNSDKPISQELYEAYASNLRRAVSAVPVENDLAAQWQANVARFAAYKAYDATATIRRAVGEAGDIDLGRAVLHTYNRYQAAEYNTAVARARTGKQWQQFIEQNNATLFPNIRWLPSRSATPREEHMPFYNRIWPKNDPFWLTNQPGTLWNCKCDWEQTDDDPTADNPSRDIVMPGLDQNPATSGMIFTDTAPYIRKAGKDVEKEARGIFRDYINAISTTDRTDVECPIGREKHRIDLSSNFTNKHFVQDMFDEKEYWFKNTILTDPQPFLDKAELLGRKESDPEHNTNRRTRSLKRKTDYFYYYRVKTSYGKDVILHVGRYRDSGVMYLYSASSYIPKDIETP